jgi:uncharacterized protein (DUF885 family)
MVPMDRLPAVLLLAFFLPMLCGTAFAQDSPATLRELAHNYYEWQAREWPVDASDAGLHTYDGKLTDYSPAAIAERERHIRELLDRVRGMHTDGWSKDDRIDRTLFTSQLEMPDFSSRVLKPEQTDALLYTDLCGNAIFTLLKKDYDTHRNRALSAEQRMEAIPAMLAQAKMNLTAPVRLYAELAIESARDVDPLFTQSLMTLADQFSPAERQRFIATRDRALKSIHDFADDLAARLNTMPAFRPMGVDNYNYLLHHVYLLPIDATQLAMLGEAELARYSGLEALLPNPAMADPDPSRSRSIPRNQEEFLAAYESRLKDILAFLRRENLITIPSYMGAFHIRQLPDAFKPTNPGGFMNPPGVYDSDSRGMYFIPTYDPASKNFYIRAAIEEPRPILGHEGIPGHFLQLSIANHLPDEIRRHHGDNVFIEGWALYTEEMLLRRGFYAAGSAAEGQILRLSRYRAARVGVDVNLHTGRWTFDECVKYFMQSGGLDKEAATGEAAGAASEPTQKMTYITGKFQILRLLGRYRDHLGSAFTLKRFHDDLLANGSLPLSIQTWILLDDSSDLDKALRQ